MDPLRVIIMGAAGRDFHNFNTVFRDDPRYHVASFTATQIPNIDGRRYPHELAGNLYPEGIPIFPEQELPRLIKQHEIDQVVFSYSDVSFHHVMTKAAEVNAAGADFILLGPKRTMLKSTVPVIAVLAVRTGAGKTQTSRKLSGILRAMGVHVAAVRHPMPYGDLVRQKVQRFQTLDDLKLNDCTVEEMEEYEPHISNGTVVYAGVDYEAILRRAEEEADVIIWDGGNNDTSFFVPDLTITVTDPLRAGHELQYYPGETNLLTADVVIINKVDTASLADINRLKVNITHRNPTAILIEAASPIRVEQEELIRGKSVLVVEDGPTLTHGGMSFGAGFIAARNCGARQIIDPRQWAVGSIADSYRKYPTIGHILPAMGYGKSQLDELEWTINRTPCDTVVIGTPIDLNRVISIERPTVRVHYALKEVSHPTLEDVAKTFVARHRVGVAEKV